MAIKNLGNFKSTTGVYEMKLDDETIIEFEKGYNAEDVKRFMEAFGEKTTKAFSEFIEWHFKKNESFKGSGMNKDDQEMFLIKKGDMLIKGYMIMFGLTTAEDYEKAIQKAKDKALGVQEDSPIESTKKTK